MTQFPEDDRRDPAPSPDGEDAAFEPASAYEFSPQPAVPPLFQEANLDMPLAAVPAATAEAPTPYPYPAPPYNEKPLFHSFTQTPVRRFERIPNFGHFAILCLLASGAFIVLILALALVSHFHLLGLQISTQSATDIGFNLAVEAILYLQTFALCLAIFPLIWHEGYFRGLEWCFNVVQSKFWQLVGIASLCCGLALLDQILMPGPANAPIEKMISSPGAAWMMFAFGVTMAPFFEEMFFRGFLLPSLCTAWDWIVEKTNHIEPHPLDANGHPQWSIPAMAIGSVLTSIPFALVHAAQQGHSVGPFILMIVISSVLCAVRLKFRSLAASTLVHSSYNFFLFSMEFMATGGFRHFDKM